MKFITILTLLVLLTALSEAKKKGKKKSHKKKTTTAATTIENSESKSTLFPKPLKKLAGDVSDEKSTPDNLGLTTINGLTTEGPIGLVGTMTSIGSPGSTASVGLTGSTASGGLTGSTVSGGLTGSTTSVGLTGSTASGGLTGSTASAGITGSTESVALKGSTPFLRSADLSALGIVGPITLDPASSAVPLSPLQTLVSVTLLTTATPVIAITTGGLLRTGNESTVIQTTLNNTIITAIQQSNSSNVTATDEIIDFADDDEEVENEEGPVEDTRSDELSFIHEFQLPSDEPNLAKYEQDDYEIFITEPMPEYRRKKRHIRISNTDSRKKRSNNIIEEENLGTTISGFKFTGGESLPRHKSVYKNINI